jgi:hypothetical protein
MIYDISKKVLLAHSCTQTDIYCTYSYYIYKHYTLTNSTLVRREWLSSRCPSITHNKDVGESIGTRTEGVLEDSARIKDDL